MRLRPIPVILALLAASGTARAQPTPEVRNAASALFEDGRRLMNEGKLDVACPKLAESQRLDPGMGTLYNLGLCYEAQNRTASARACFQEVASLAMTAGMAEREKAARGKVAGLEPRLMRLEIVVLPAAQAAGVEVKRDGAVIAPALWGTAVPLDPGRYVVSATAPGHEPWQVTVVLEQPGRTVKVEVPPPPPVAPPRSAGSPPTVAPTGPVPPPAPPPPAAPAGPAAPRAWQRPVGISATALGAVGMGLGVGFGFLAKSAFDATNDGGGCVAKTNACTQAGVDARAAAVAKGNVGTGLFIAGAVLAAGGVVLWATAPSAPKAEVGLGLGGVSVRGAF